MRSPIRSARPAPHKPAQETTTRGKRRECAWHSPFRLVGGLRNRRDGRDDCVYLGRLKGMPLFHLPGPGGGKPFLNSTRMAWNGRLSTFLIECAACGGSLSTSGSSGLSGSGGLSGAARVVVLELDERIDDHHARPQVV